MTSGKLEIKILILIDSTILKGKGLDQSRILNSNFTNPHNHNHHKGFYQFQDNFEAEGQYIILAVA